MSEDRTAKPTRKEREYSRHHREILDVAVSLFAENGYHQTTMQMIADRAEFSVGYLYKHFPGKEDMYRELLAYHMGRLDELIAEVQALGLAPLAEMRRTYEEVCRHFNKHRDFMRIFHEELGGNFPEFAEGKRRHFEDLVENLDRAQQAGELRAYDSRILAAAIQGATKALMAELAERPEDDPFDSLPQILFSLLIDPARS